jgi:hypothetical protein
MNQNSSVQNKPLVQGDIGTRIMDVGGISYTWSVSSPALVTDGTVVGNVLTLIKNGWINIKTGGIGAAYLLERGAIRINKEGVDCSASFKSDNPSSFIASYGTNGSAYIARVAKWYDSYFTFTFRGISSANLAIESAEINFDPEIGERYFVGGSQAPYFSVNSYKLSGTITFLVPPSEFQNFRSLYQNGSDFPPGATLPNGGYPGNPVSGNLAGTRSFYVTGIENANLIIGLPGTGGFNLQLGNASMTTEVTSSIKAGDITKVTLKFVSYANSSTNESS